MTHLGGAKQFYFTWDCDRTAATAIGQMPRGQLPSYLHLACGKYYAVLQCGKFPAVRCPRRCYQVLPLSYSLSAALLYNHSGPHVYSELKALTSTMLPPAKSM